MLTHDVRIKSEKSVQQAISAPQQQQSPPIIMTSRTIETESFGEDLLMEIGS